MEVATGAEREFSEIEILMGGRRGKGKVNNNKLILTVRENVALTPLSY